MSSLSDRIKVLEDDLKADPPRISVYHDLPFAILGMTRKKSGHSGVKRGCWQHVSEKEVNTLR